MLLFLVCANSMRQQHQSAGCSNPVVVCLLSSASFSQAGYPDSKRRRRSASVPAGGKWDVIWKDLPVCGLWVWGVCVHVFACVRMCVCACI